jgi:hypothetical protein
LRPLAMHGLAAILRDTRTGRRKRAAGGASQDEVVLSRLCFDWEMSGQTSNAPQSHVVLKAAASVSSAVPI